MGICRENLGGNKEESLLLHGVQEEFSEGSHGFSVPVLAAIVYFSSGYL